MITKIESTKDHGLRKDTRSKITKQTDYHFGGDNFSFPEILVPDGNWTSYLPIYEKQSVPAFDTMSCVTFSCLNIIETLIKIHTGYEQNLSDRFLAKASGTNKQGNDLWTVANTLRHKGDCDEIDYPFEGATWEEYMKTLTPELLTKALKFLEDWDINYLFVGLEKDVLMTALKYSPLQVTVHFNAIKSSDFGDLYTDINEKKTWNHAVELFNFKLGKYWEIFDHYEKCVKRVDWDYKFGAAMAFSLTRKTPQEIYAEYLGDKNIPRQRIFGNNIKEVKEAAIKVGINPINLRNWNIYFGGKWIPFADK